MGAKARATSGVALAALLLPVLTWMTGSLPRSAGDWTLTRMGNIASGIEFYLEEFESLPPQEEESLFATISADNPKKLDFLPYKEAGDRPWRMDAWGSPYRIFTGSAGIVIWSAGKDQVFADKPGDDDDLALFRQPSPAQTK